MSLFLENIISKAKSDIKRIVLPEALDARTLLAAREIEKQGFAEIILLEGNLEKKDEYAEKLFEIRKHKGLTTEQARELVENPLYYGTMMVQEGDADGLVAGAANSTADVLRPALQILKTAPGSKIVSSAFFMSSPNKELGNAGVFVFADCAINPNPTAEELAEIAIASGETFERFFGVQARIAMLSYSTFGSGKGELVDKVALATNLAKEKAPNMQIEGEMQLDAAIIPEVGKIKAPQSLVAGKANVLVFPDLQSGNIGYKIAQRIGNCEAFGPMLQGIAKPVNDLSRGASVEDIVGVVAITSVQAQSAI